MGKSFLDGLPFKKKESEMRQNLKENIYFQLVVCVVGLFFCACGIYMMIEANIGLAPWDVFAMGLSYQTHMSYGTALIVISIGVIAIDVLLKEKIGFGTLFDATLVGIFVDMLTAIDPLHTPDSVFGAVLMLVCGMFSIAIGQCIYMSSGQGCGPRDTLLVALGKRMKKLPIGTVCMILLCTVLILGLLLKGPIGIGTVISTFGLGVCLQIVCRIVRFEPRDVEHKNMIESLQVMRGHTESL